MPGDILSYSRLNADCFSLSALGLANGRLSACSARGVGAGTFVNWRGKSMKRLEVGVRLGKVSCRKIPIAQNAPSQQGFEGKRLLITPMFRESANNTHTVNN
jgi:hypothetical protein